MCVCQTNICIYVECLTRTRVPTGCTATPEDDRGEKAEPRRYALLTLIRYRVGGEGAGGCGGVVVTIVKRAHGVKRRAPAAQRRLTVWPIQRTTRPGNLIRQQHEMV